MSKDAERKVIHEFKTFMHRWEHESDLEQAEILECLSNAVNEYYDEEIIEFESEIILEDEEMNIYKPTGEKLEPWPLMVRQLERENKELKKEIERLKQTIQELKKGD